MKVTVDTSAVIAVLLGENNRERIIRRTKGVDLIAPASLHWEMGNAFSAMFKRGRLGADVALQAISRYEEIPIQLVEVNLAEAVQIAEKRDLYAYDAYMLLVARRHRAPLLTLDGGLKEPARQSVSDLLEVKS